MAAQLGKRGNPGLRGRLIERSVEAYILALETINRLSAKYRVETFAYLLCNSWELLLKAKIIQEAGDRNAIYYRQKPGEPRRTLALADCLKRAFPNENDPTRRNVERVKELRDEAVHLVISQVPCNVLALFQASVLNYHNRLINWFGVCLSDRVPVGMMTIVYDLDPKRFDLANPILRRQLGRDTADYLARFQGEINREYLRLGKPTEFSIDVQYKLALVKNLGDADIVLSSGAAGTATGLVEIPKESSRTHPYRQTELIQQLNNRLDGVCRVNSYDVQCVIKVHNAKRRPEFHYKSGIVGSPSQYSASFVDWVVAQHSRDGEFFAKARQKARAGRAGR